MSCPNCTHLMNYVNLDKQNILHCGNCGSCFFEENGINRISGPSAQKLAGGRKTDEISGNEKLCPLDHCRLIPVSDEEAIPQGVTILRCKQCHGVFVYPDDLVKFKTAQSAKIDFFKAWVKPLPSLRTVLVVSFTAIVLGSAFYRFSSFVDRYSRTSQASDLIKQIKISTSGRYLMVFFKTQTPFKSKIIFFDKTNSARLEKVISEALSTTHSLTTGDLNVEDEIEYQIILINKEGKEITTELKKISYQQ